MSLDISNAVQSESQVTQRDRVSLEKAEKHEENTEASKLNCTNSGFDEIEEEYHFTIGQFLALAAMQLGYMGAVFCIQMISAILTTINNDIGPSSAYAWISTSQVIPVGVFGLLVGRLGDIFGRRNLIIMGDIFGIIGCAICATAQNINVCIGGGIFIGTASACQQVAWAASSEMVPRKYRALVIGLFEMSCVPAGAFGPLIGNAIAKNTTWRWAYWIPFILNCLSFIMVFLFYRPRDQYIKEEGKTRLQEAADLDWIGFFLCATGICLFLLGISFGGNQLPWKSGGTISMIVIGILLLVLCGLYEAYCGMILPLFPPIVFQHFRRVTCVLIGTFLYGMLYYSTAVLWPQQVQGLYTTDLIKVGWYSSALGIAGIISSPIFGTLFTFGHARSLFIFIIVLGTVASGCMATVSPTSSTASTVLVAMEGVCVGGGMIVATAMVQLAVEHQYIGLVTALAVAARNIGGAVAQVIYTSIFTGRLKHNIIIYVAEPLIKSGVSPEEIEIVIEAIESTDTTQLIDKLTPTQLEVGLEGLHQAIVHALRVVYLSSIAFGVVGTVFVCFCRNVNHLLTAKVDVQLDEGAKLQGVTDTGKGYIIPIEEQMRYTSRWHGTPTVNQKSPSMANVDG